MNVSKHCFIIIAYSSSRRSATYCTLLGVHTYICTMLVNFWCLKYTKQIIHRTGNPCLRIPECYSPAQ